MKLGMQVGLGRGHIALDGDPQVPLPQRGTAPPQFLAHICCGHWPNGLMDQDATWYGGRPRPGQHCVRCGPSSIPAAQPPNFGPYLLWPNGWMAQDATWDEGMPRPRPHSVRWGSSSHSQKGNSPQFSAHVYCGQTIAHLSYC